MLLLTCVHINPQLSCAQLARNTKNVPLCVARNVENQRPVGNRWVVWQVATVPLACCGIMRASVCPPDCVPASWEASLTLQAASLCRDAIAGEDWMLGTKGKGWG